MKPATGFGSIAAVYAAGALMSAIAFARVLDPYLLASTTHQSTGEAVAWLIGFALLTTAAIIVYHQSKQAAACEQTFTGLTVACQAQRNAATVAAAFVWIATLSLVLAILTVANVVHLRDGLTATATLGGPVATVWYWASTLSYVPLMRKNPPKP